MDKLVVFKIQKVLNNSLYRDGFISKEIFCGVDNILIKKINNFCEEC